MGGRETARREEMEEEQKEEGPQRQMALWAKRGREVEEEKGSGRRMWIVCGSRRVNEIAQNGIGVKGER